MEEETSLELAPVLPHQLILSKIRSTPLVFASLSIHSRGTILRVPFRAREMEECPTGLKQVILIPKIIPFPSAAA